MGKKGENGMRKTGHQARYNRKIEQAMRAEELYKGLKKNGDNAATNEVLMHTISLIMGYSYSTIYTYLTHRGVIGKKYKNNPMIK